MTYASCPKCNAGGAERMSFTWWGGVIGPKVLTHVKCPGCGHAYNGKTGRDNTNGIIIYSVIVGVIAFGFVGLMFTALGALSILAK